VPETRLTMAKNGLVVIPASFLEVLGVKAGDEVILILGATSCASPRGDAAVGVFWSITTGASRTRPWFAPSLSVWMVVVPACPAMMVLVVLLFVAAVARDALQARAAVSVIGRWPQIGLRESHHRH
jgi:hypothetical protein